MAPGGGHVTLPTVASGGSGLQQRMPTPQHPFACDVLDSICHHQQYVRKKKHSGRTKKIAGKSY
eukprot:COSAG02_NODE_331_length_24480_cov_22.114720_12_plen_64_part_00